MTFSEISHLSALHGCEKYPTWRCGKRCWQRADQKIGTSLQASCNCSRCLEQFKLGTEWEALDPGPDSFCPKIVRRRLALAGMGFGVAALPALLLPVRLLVEARPRRSVIIPHQLGTRDSYSTCARHGPKCSCGRGARKALTFDTQIHRTFSEMHGCVKPLPNKVLTP